MGYFPRVYTSLTLVATPFSRILGSEAWQHVYVGYSPRVYMSLTLVATPFSRILESEAWHNVTFHTLKARTEKFTCIKCWIFVTMKPNLWWNNLVKKKKRLSEFLISKHAHGPPLLEEHKLEANMMSLRRGPSLHESEESQCLAHAKMDLAMADRSANCWTGGPMAISPTTVLERNWSECEESNWGHTWFHSWTGALDLRELLLYFGKKLALSSLEKP